MRGEGAMVGRVRQNERAEGSTGGAPLRLVATLKVTAEMRGKKGSWKGDVVGVKATGSRKCMWRRGERRSEPVSWVANFY